MNDAVDGKFQCDKLFEPSLGLRVSTRRNVVVEVSVAHMPEWEGALTTSFGVAAISNVMNNLPSGLLVGSALQSTSLSTHLRSAVLIGVDLGPNLSVTGSLATILWLIALRREGHQIGAFTFLKCGLATMPPALFLATLALLV